MPGMVYVRVACGTLSGYVALGQQLLAQSQS